MSPNPEYFSPLTDVLSSEDPDIVYDSFPTYKQPLIPGNEVVTSQGPTKNRCKKINLALLLALLIASGLFYVLCVPKTPYVEPPPIHYDNVTDDDIDNLSTPSPTPVVTSSPTVATCFNKIMDSDESDVDCGGSDCVGCEVGLTCRKDEDCKGHSCDAGTSKCAESTTPPPTPSPTACTGEIKVTGKPFETSHSIIWIYDNPDSWGTRTDRFDDNSAYIHITKSVTPPSGTYSIIVPPGVYSLMLIDDKNDNGVLDTNWMGVPNEGCGASNGAKGGPMGGPSWDDAKFEVKCGQAANVEVELWHM